MHYQENFERVVNFSRIGSVVLEWMETAGHSCRRSLGMQDFNFVQMQSNLPKSNYFCPIFSQI